MKRKIIPFVVVPTLLISTLVLGYITLKNSWNLELASYAIFVFSLIYIVILERVIPLKEEWKPTKQTLKTDVKHFIFSAVLFDAFGKALALSFVVYLQKHLFLTFSFWDSLPFFAVFIIASLLGDFLPYLYHRISHVGNKKSSFSLLLWKIHSIHHLPTSLNWFKTNWIHPINIFLNTILKMVPLLLLGFSDEIIFLVGITYVVIAYLSHANIKTKKSYWDYFVVTPQVHHFHHSTKMNEAKNFSNTFPFWDLLFGTYYNRKGPVKEVGVVKIDEIIYPNDKTYIKQLIFPLVSSNCCK
ncbi:Sterol desaturase/sphingolipid hydroxylase, fatty acid hydroxylase superfamily [Tenacibaculum sediminilitoris]|uniref:sterol desaturase family protein n=1 Tax=Tenacibaculum sediminilitoris TaxID=1820334 RepID=UPI003894AC88